MFMYVVLWLFAFISGFLYEKTSRKYIRRILVVTFIFVSSWALACRDFKGTTDYTNYGGYFYLMQRSYTIVDAMKTSFQEISRLTPVFMLLLYMISKITDSLRIVFLLFVLLEMGIDAYSFQKIKINPLWGILGKISLMSITWYGLGKQALAISLILLASVFWIEGKRKCYYILMAVSLGIHITTVCVLLLMFFEKISISEKNYVCWVVVFGMSLLMGHLFSLTLHLLWSRSGGYAIDGAGKGWNLSLALFVVNSFIYLICIGHKEKIYKYCINAAMLSTAIALASTQGEIIRRFVFCFSPIVVIGWLNTCKIQKKYFNKVVIRGAVFFCFFIIYGYLSYNLPSYSAVGLSEMLKSNIV